MIVITATRFFHPRPSAGPVLKNITEAPVSSHAEMLRNRPSDTPASGGQFNSDLVNKNILKVIINLIFYSGTVNYNPDRSEIIFSFDQISPFL